MICQRISSSRAKLRLSEFYSCTRLQMVRPVRMVLLDRCHDGPSCVDGQAERTIQRPDSKRVFYPVRNEYLQCFTTADEIQKLLSQHLYSVLLGYTLAAFVLARYGVWTIRSLGWSTSLRALVLAFEPKHASAMFLSQNQTCPVINKSFVEPNVSLDAVRHLEQAGITACICRGFLSPICAEELVFLPCK